MSARPAIGLVGLLAAGCRDGITPPEAPSYEAMTGDCADELDIWTPTASALEIIETMDGACASSLGDTIGLDWDSFGFDPWNLEDSETGAYLLAGLLTMFAGEQALVESALADEDLPVVLGDDLARLREVHGFDEETPLAYVWYEFLGESMSSARFAETTPSESAASYYRETQRAVFTPLILQNRSLSETALPAFAAAIIVHETSHRVTHGHVWCSDGSTESSCDATPEGSFGAEVWWLHDWQTRHESVLVDPGCTPLDDLKRGACTGGIRKYDDWPPCERICAE